MIAFEIISYCAMFFSIGSYLLKSPRHALAGFCCSNALWGAFYLSQGAYTALAITAINILRNGFGAFADHKTMIRAVIALLIAGWILFPFLYQTVSDFIPMLAMTLTSVSVYMRDKPLVFRSLELTIAFVWLAYGFALGSAALVFTCAFQAMICFCALLIYDLNKGISFEPARSYITIKVRQIIPFRL